MTTVFMGAAHSARGPATPALGNFYNKQLQPGGLPRTLWQAIAEDMGAGPACIAWLKGLQGRLERNGYAPRKGETFLNYVNYNRALALRLAGEEHELFLDKLTLDAIFANDTVRNIMEREMVRGAPIITNEQRAAFAVMAMQDKGYAPEDAFSVHVAACGIMQMGSPIVNAISKAFPRSSILATDVSFPYSSFPVPANARFELLDLLNGSAPLPAADVVHCTNFLQYLEGHAFDSAIDRLAASVNEGGLVVTDRPYLGNFIHSARGQGRRINWTEIERFESS